MKQQKPILHGRDHACGGADPLPGYCQLLETIDELTTHAAAGGGDYRSVQTGVFTVSSGGIPGDYETDNWPRITIPEADWNTNTALGNGLWAVWSCQVQGPVYRVDMQPFTGDVADVVDSSSPVADDGWVALAAAGWLLDTGGAAEVTADQETWMRYQPSGTGTVQIRNGDVRLYWLAAEAPPPAGTATYPGGYPIVDADVASNADISPLKLDHPGGTTQFLRSDGTFAAASLQVEY